MLSGERAFTGDSAIAIMAAILQKEPEPLDTTPALQSILARCLRKSAAERFQTMTEVRTALEQATTKPVEKRPSIAVLPFANMSADKENEYFSDGLAEEILNLLAKIPGLKVIARTSSFAFWGMEQERVAKVTGRLGLSPRSSMGGLVLFASLIVIAGCGSPAQFLSARDSEIKDSTNAIETARDDRQRAKAYSSRGTAYSEKARYSRMSKLIPNDEYERLFGLAMEDHNQAVTLDPNNAEVYFNRAQTNYDRGTLDLVENKEPLLVNPTTKSWLDAAASDFERAAEIDPKNSLTLDRLGLTYEQADEEDKAVRAYTQEWALDRLGKQRLADAYCFFGFRHQQQKELAAAAAAYQKSIEFGVADDKSCPYDPLGNGIEIYTIETREYDKAWEMVHQAQKANRLIAPELIERLKKDSKRTR